MTTFYDRDLGWFRSDKADLSDLGGPYLAVALARRDRIRADDEKMARRRDAVFATGASAASPVPMFEGHPLGSMESYTFYEGYASTHEDFKNPYRRENWRSSAKCV